MSPALAEDFVLEELLGRGGMGSVHVALQRSTGRRVAIKLLPADALDADRIARFDREAAALSRLGHPNIVHIYTHGRDADGRPFLAMERVEGATLQALLTEGPLDVGRAVTLAAQIVEGLAYAHERQIAHRDVKPSNVMVTRVLDRELVKLVDFGLAKLLDDGVDAGTASGRLLGSAPYMSPEQWNQLRDIDGRADLYSFGCVFYEMLTGRPPFSASGMVGYLKAHLAGACRPAQELRAELAEHPEVLALLARVMATDRDARPASARALLNELRPLELRYRAALAPLPPAPAAKSASLGGAEPTLTSSEGAGLGSGWVSSVMTEPAPSAIALDRRRRVVVPIVAAIAGAAAAVAIVLAMSSGPTPVAGPEEPASVVESPPAAPRDPRPSADPPAPAPTEPAPVTAAVDTEPDDSVNPEPEEGPAVVEAARVVHLESRPSGARVIYDGAIRGKTPLDLELRDGAVQRAVLKLPGHRPRTVSVAEGAAGDGPLVVRLAKARAHGASSGEAGADPPTEPETKPPALNLDRLPIE